MITLPICKDYHILSYRNDLRYPLVVYMTHINEEDEEALNKGKSILLERGKRTFSISPNNVYGYGAIDFSKNSEDSDNIEDLDFLDYLTHNGVRIYANYDYETHTCISPKKYPMFYETWSPLKVVKFAHASLGKPERVIIFKREILK